MRAAFSNCAIESRRCLIIFSIIADDVGVVELDALVDFALLDRGEEQADRPTGAPQSLARIAVFMSSVICCLSEMLQYSFGGSIWLRRRL